MEKGGGELEIGEGGQAKGCVRSGGNAALSTDLAEFLMTTFYVCITYLT